jgi:hypothetical protein
MRIKLFENFGQEDFVNAIKDSFSHLIDDERVFIEIHDGGEEVIIWSKINISYSSDFESFLSHKEEEMSLLKEIKESVERIDKIYDIDYDIDCDFSVSNSDYEFVLHFTPGKSKEGDFYKETKHGIKFDYSKLRKILNLPNSVDIYTSFGSSHRLNFEFKNKEELDKYKDQLIKDFQTLKVFGVELNTEITWSYSTFSGNEVSKYKIYRDYKQSYTGASGRGERIINTVKFGLNPGLDYY